MNASVDDRRSLARSTATQTVLTAVSRLTGFARVVIVAAVLGATFLGNTYQSANTIPNIVFELFAAGALQAVLVPALVARFDRADDAGAERLAGSVLGFTALALTVFAAIGAIAAPAVMRVLFAGVEDPAIAADQVRLGTVFLWIFLPQVVVYDVGLVATAVLHARGRFALPAVAPAVNNVVVCVAYGVFWVLRDGAEPTLELSALEIAVLAGGTSVAVVAFCALPIAGAWRTGFRFRMNLDRTDPDLRMLGRQGLWAAVYLGMTQVLLGVVLVLSNRVEGGVVGYQVAFTFFLLPHALFALPVLTTLFPVAARQAQAADLAGVATTVDRGARAISYFVLPVAAGLVALAGPIANLALFGEATGGARDLVVAATIGFAPGLVGYGLFYFLTRVAYALGDTRMPALVHVGVVGIGVVSMLVSTTLISSDRLGRGTEDGAAEIGALAWAHSITYLLGALVLVVLVGRRLGTHRLPVGRLLATGVVASAAAGLVMAVVARGLDIDGRLGSVADVVVGGGAGVAVYIVIQQTLGGPRLANVFRLIRPGGADG